MKNFIHSATEIRRDGKAGAALTKRLDKAIEQKFPGAEILRHVPTYCTTWIKVNASIKEICWSDL